MSGSEEKPGFIEYDKCEHCKGKKCDHNKYPEYLKVGNVDGKWCINNIHLCKECNECVFCSNRCGVFEPYDSDQEEESSYQHQRSILLHQKQRYEYLMKMLYKEKVEAESVVEKEIQTIKGYINGEWWSFEVDLEEMVKFFQELIKKYKDIYYQFPNRILKQLLALKIQLKKKNISL